MCMSAQGALKDVAMGVDEAGEEGYAWEEGDISGRNELRPYIGFLVEDGLTWQEGDIGGRNELRSYGSL